MFEVLSDYGEEVETFKVRRFLEMVELAKGESAWRDYSSMLRKLLLEFDALLSRVNLRQDTVRIMTVHGAKGLQFPVIFIPDLSNAVFPNLYWKPNMEEERRLFFVAATRCQEVLHMSWAEQGPRGHPTGASPFVEEILSSHDCAGMLTYPNGEVRP